MTAADPTIVLSSGEPAGIGPDICAMIAAEPIAARLLILGDAMTLERRARSIGAAISVQVLSDARDVEPHVPGIMQVVDMPVRAEVEPGKLDPENAEYVLEILRTGTALCQDTHHRALVTAPVQKSVINEAGVPFTGHTEFLASLTATALPVMMLASGDLRVALATTHLPLADVASTLSKALVEEVLAIIDRELRDRLRIHAPRIAVLGLNPHAGERGVLGSEETTIIEPALSAARERGLELIGPLPADTAFTPNALEACDVILAMYHDQGLPAIKALAFGEVVNVTLGLPIVRTSVDHGTALALAATGDAKVDSLRAAIRVAIEMTTGIDA